MTNSEVTYQSDLLTIATHLQANNEIITDALIKNNYKSKGFSSTDFFATSLASCRLTTIGIKVVNK